MGEDALLVIIFGTLHLFGIAFVGLLLLPLMREEQPELWSPPDDDDDHGGGNDRISPVPPRGPSSGGIPLPSAVQARVRLRGPGRISDLTPTRERRPAHVPAPVPQREREPV